MKARDIERVLPGVFRRGLPPHDLPADRPKEERWPLLRLLTSVMSEVLLDPAESKLDTIDRQLDPRRADPEFVAFLARWVDLDLPVTTGPGYLRELVATAVTLAKWRGTLQGLKLFLQTATGEQSFEIDEEVRGHDGEIVPFRIRVHAPRSIAAKDRPMVRRIVELEKPAYVTSDPVVFDR